ncbi:MAG: acyl-CoA/acyl-ACP dehydrogenase [Pseudomonadales bacterium]|nr:acyl-CoA/acyl-ACP dehydrogenase [Pseudomonadales bacterium]
MSKTPSQVIDFAGSLIAEGRKIVDKGLSHIKVQCLDGGKVSTTKLDDHQLVSYELAYCAAELTASDFILDYCRKVRDIKGGDELGLEENLALMYCAETINNCRGRLVTRLSDFGLSHQDVVTGFGSEESNDFISQQLSSANMEAMGRTLIKLDGVTGTSILDNEKEMMRDSFRQFANDVVMPIAEDVHRKDLIIPDEILKPLIDLGCFALSIPQQYGGLQPDDREDNLGMIVVTEELTRGSLGAAGSLITRPEILARALLKGGTEEQRKYWLPKIAVADPLCAVAVTEPNFGSDVASIKLKASKVEGGWTLNGAKTWCTFGGKAGVLLTIARSNPDASLGHRGLSLFFVEKPSSDGNEFEHVQDGGGKISGKAISTIGYRGMHSFDVFFDDYFVPDSSLIGGPEGENKGFYYTMAGFAGGRIQTAARATGIMQAAYEKALSYSQERKVFGQAVSDYQLTAYKIARMGMLLSTMRQFTYAVARMMDAGEGQMEASLVKLVSCKTSEWICREAMQIHGGMGYAEESAVSRYFIDSRVLSIFEGAEETLALKVIARTLVEDAL